LLKLFLFLPILLLSQELFILPDEAEHFSSTLNMQIHKAKKSIHILTPFMNDYSTIKSLKGMAKKGVNISIITKDQHAKQNRISHLSLYENIRVYHLKTDFGIKGFLICIDKDDMFLLANNLDYKILSKEYSFALHTKEVCQKRFVSLKKRCLNKE